MLYPMYSLSYLYSDKAYECHTVCRETILFRYSQFILIIHSLTARTTKASQEVESLYLTQSIQFI